MTQPSVIHDRFVIERTFPSAPARVFAAFSDPKAKARWFGSPPGWIETANSLDFRVGGIEINNGGPPGGPESKFTCTYLDIVPDRRIVYSYVMWLDDRKISVSQTTVELHPAGTGTRFVMTEHGAYLDGYDNPAGRREGCEWLIGQLEASLAEPAAA